MSIVSVGGSVARVELDEPAVEGLAGRWLALDVVGPVEVDEPLGALYRVTAVVTDVSRPVGAPGPVILVTKPVIVSSLDASCAWCSSRWVTLAAWSGPSAAGSHPARRKDDAWPATLHGTVPA